MKEYIVDNNNNTLHSKEKIELIERLKTTDPSDEQLLEIHKIINGEPSQNQIVKSAIDLLNKVVDNSNQMWYKAIILGVFIGIIVFLSYRFPESDKQVWALVGTLMGFVFGQNSKILNV